MLCTHKVIGSSPIVSSYNYILSIYSKLLGFSGFKPLRVFKQEGDALEEKYEMGDPQNLG